MTLLDLMIRFIALDVAERPGARHHPAIVWGHELARMGEGVGDEVAWCSSILNLGCAILKRKRSRSAAARSWLSHEIGVLVLVQERMRVTIRRTLASVEPGWVVLVFKRGTGRGQLGPDVLDAPGHVAVLAHYDAENAPDMVSVAGGNQRNGMNVQTFPVDDIIGLVVVEPE